MTPRGIPPSSSSKTTVEDDPSNLESLERLCAKEGYRVLTAPDARTALDMLRKQRAHIVVTDLMMPGLSGIDLLKAVKAVAPETEVIMMTAYGTVETAVEAMRAGAYDFVEKPLKRMQILKSVSKAMEKAGLVAENRTLREEISQLRKREIIGTAPALRQVLEVAGQAAPSMATVLILGESGTGKELLARYVHARSQRASGPFVGVNCAAIPESILEAELFGYERGAFTGAVQKRDGRFAQARRGHALPRRDRRALALGAGEAPAGAPGGRVRAPGRAHAARGRARGGRHQPRPRGRGGAPGRFREDLFYRLNVIAITSPPLRSRPGDVPLLVEHFVRVFGQRNGKGPFTVTPAAMEKLSRYAWPGNVRELENTIERAVVLSRATPLDLADLPKQIVDNEHARQRAGGVPSARRWRRSSAW
jgi:DNA-binding NtrC family response regulator